MTTASAVSSTEDALSIEAMMAAASRETGLANFGSDEFIEPFRQLVKGAAEDIRFHAIGLMSFKADMHRLLVNRLRFEEDLRLHPEILDEEVCDPIIILGLVRTGTSKLQRMMSADPQAQKLYFWKLFNPARFPASDPASLDPRIDVARQASAMLGQLSPEFMAAHPTLAEEVDEELLLLEFSFETLVHYLLNPSAQYYAWMQGRKLHHTYRYLHRLMQYLQWQDGGKRGRPWIMKSPLHIGNLDALLEVFPKATLVHCHRDVSEVMASFSRLSEAGWRLKTDAVDPHEVGRSMLQLWSTEMNKYLQLRSQLTPKLNILDVSYAQIENDPMSVIQALHRRAGRSLSAQSVAAMQRWNQDNPKDRFGKNVYTLAQYGLSREQVDMAFADYIRQFKDYTGTDAPRVR